MDGRYGWPVPPAEEQVRWVAGAVENAGRPHGVLDLLSGSGAVQYECGIRGIPCTAAEPDPFLRWISFARSYMFRPDAGEKAGYAWERVQDDVFWESETFGIPDVPGAELPGGNAADFLGRVRCQIDREGEEGTNTLLKLALCRQIPLFRTSESFDDMEGLTLAAGCLEDIRSGIEPQPTVPQTVHLCDPRNLPHGLRGLYGAAVSVVPPIGRPSDAGLTAGMMAVMGFGDVVRRDDMCPGYPYGGTGPLTERNPCEVPDYVPSLDNGPERAYLARWFSYIRDVVTSAVGNLAGGQEARFLLPDETFCGTPVRKTSVLADILSSDGFDCCAEGAGGMRGLTVRGRR